MRDAGGTEWVNNLIKRFKLIHERSVGFFLPLLGGLDDGVQGGEHVLFSPSDKLTFVFNMVH